MQPYETPDYKYQAADEAATLFARVNHDQIEVVDVRLLSYLKDVIHHPDMKNLYEVLAVKQFFVKWQKYHFNTERVQRIIKLGESLTFSTTEGRKQITLSPVQVFMFANIYGFEETLADGSYRRLCTNFILMVPRKFGKTTMLAIPAIDDYLFGDHNSQVSIGSNTDRQALLLFKIIKDALASIDTKKRMKFTTHSVRWREGLKDIKRESTIESLSGGGQTKDGWFGSLHLQDEYGSAKYVNGHSDAAALYQVMVSSMGPRREPLSGIITTAGRVTDGPFQPMLERAKCVLRGEVEGDQQFAFICQPDAWEMTDEAAADPNVWAKVQPHLGKTVQADYYERYYKDALLDHEAWIEFNTKLLNKFVSDNLLEWVDANDIRNLQGTRRITDFKPEDGWVCFVGMDFSKGDDLCGQSYLCYHPQKKKFYVDCDFWVTEETLRKNANAPMYQLWHEQGYLHISPGRTIDENLIVSRLMEVEKHVNILQFGYDAYDAMRFVNAISAWLVSVGADPKQFLRSVKQTNATFNSAVQNFDAIYKHPDNKIEFSPNPLLPWAFGNCYLDCDKMENVKPIKKSANQKIDPAICTLEGLIMLDERGAVY